MKETTRQIKSITRVLYLYISLLIVFTAVNLYFYLNYNSSPTTILVKNPEAATNKTSWHLKSLNEIPDSKSGEVIQYGYQLITNTPSLIGPKASESSLRYAGNNLACNNCHLDGGRKIGSGSFVGVSNRFPQFRGRENKMGTLEERINGCLKRSMNGRIIPVDSKEMKAMIAYMDWLSEGVPEAIAKKYKGYVSIVLPTQAADPIQGKVLYKAKCTVCHQDNGQGIPKADGTPGYLYPPLAGNDTFNDGAGMHRVITSAQFIKGNMPFGATYDAPQVSDQEAYDIAAYINSLPRPKKANKQADFPDKKLKPVSTPYGPWLDSFSATQHQFGPFQPIMAFYKKQYQLMKKK